MTGLGWFLIALGFYCLISAFMATMFMQTPYQGEGWLRLFIFWPLIVFSGRA